jgi:hypothetical protein
LGSEPRLLYSPSRWRQGPRKQDSRDKELVGRATTTTATSIILLYNDRCGVRDPTLARTTQHPPSDNQNLCLRHNDESMSSDLRKQTNVPGKNNQINILFCQLQQRTIRACVCVCSALVYGRRSNRHKSMR